MEDEELNDDILFLACTRPAMIAGVPMEAFGFNIIITGVAFLGGNNLLYLLVAPVLHVVFRLIVKNDYNQFRVLLVWFNTKLRCRNRGVWGGSSGSPIRQARRFAAKDLDYA